MGAEKSNVIYKDVCYSLDQSIMIDDNDYLDGFRGPISIIIDGALSDLVQNGIGTPVNVFDNPETTWDDFFNDDGLKDRGSARQYVYTRVILEFDSPNPNIVSILKERTQELLWRAREDYDKPTT